jgi:hypothetical protein
MLQQNKLELTLASFTFRLVQYMNLRHLLGTKKSFGYQSFLPVRLGSALMLKN